MSNTTKVLGALSLLACLSVGGRAHAQTFSINFDENGNATVAVFNGATYAESGFLAPDQSGAFMGANVLTYALPAFVGGGGLNVLDLSGAISDNLYFYAGTNNSFMEYTSQAGGRDLADTGVTDFGYNGATETANDTFSFVAGSGDPATTNFYNGISSSGAVPEPGTYALLGSLGLTGAALLRRRRK